MVVLFICREDLHSINWCFPIKKRERERQDGTEFSKHLSFDTISAKIPLLVFYLTVKCSIRMHAFCFTTVSFSLVIEMGHNFSFIT